MVAYSFKHRFVDPIRAGLGTLTWHGPDLPQPKRQTIRAVGLRRHARPSEILQLYCGMRHPGCFLIGLGICVSVSEIHIMVRKTSLLVDLVDPDQLDDFAKVDGFASAIDMHAFWKTEHGIGRFKGVLIRWEPKS